MRVSAATCSGSGPPASASVTARPSRPRLALDTEQGEHGRRHVHVAGRRGRGDPLFHARAPGQERVAHVPRAHAAVVAHVGRPARAHRREIGAGHPEGAAPGGPREREEQVGAAVAVRQPDQLEREGAVHAPGREDHPAPVLRLDEAGQPRDPLRITVLHVERDRLAAAGQDHVGGIGRRLQLGLDQGARHVHPRGIGGEPVVGDHQHAGGAGVEPRQHPRDLPVAVAERLARGGRAHADVMLAVVRLGEPVDDDSGRELGKHVLAQHPLRPVDRVVEARAARLLHRRRARSGPAPPR